MNGAPAASTGGSNGASNGAPSGSNGATKTTAAPVNGKPSGTQPPANGTPTETKPPESFRYKTKLKVGGKEKEFDFSDQAALDRELAIGLDARAKREVEGRELNELRGWFKKFQGNPEEALAALGYNADERALQRAQREAQMAELTPEQRELASARQEIEDLRNHTKKEKEQQAQEAEQQRTLSIRNYTRRQTLELLKHAGFDLKADDKDPHSLRRRGAFLRIGSNIQRAALKNKLPPLSAQQLGVEAHKQWASDVTILGTLMTNQPEYATRNPDVVSGLRGSLFPAELDGAALLERLGPELRKRINQAQLAALERGQQPQHTQAQHNGLHAQADGRRTPLDFYTLQRNRNR